MSTIFSSVLTVLLAGAGRGEETGQPQSTRRARAVFAGGCFWCLEGPFHQKRGVIDVVAGYTGGSRVNPRYEEVCTGRTGHYEAVEVVYNPEEVSYEELLDIFWRQIDPTDVAGQFADRGTHYCTAIFYSDEAQRKAAEASKQRLNESGRFSRPVATAILAEQPFYPAEEYHQDYYLKNAAHYGRYKAGSGRTAFLNRFWRDREESDGSSEV